MRRLDVGMTPITLLNEAVTLLKEGGGIRIVQCTFLRSREGGNAGGGEGGCPGQGAYTFSVRLDML